jgi:hypothetical protein
MACKECRERREAMIEAALQGRLMAAAGHVVKGAAEMAGLRPKGKPPKAVRKSAKAED